MIFLLFRVWKIYRKLHSTNTSLPKWSYNTLNRYCLTLTEIYNQEQIERAKLTKLPLQDIIHVSDGTKRFVKNRICWFSTAWKYLFGEYFNTDRVGNWNQTQTTEENYTGDQNWWHPLIVGMFKPQKAISSKWEVANGC